MGCGDELRTLARKAMALPGGIRHVVGSGLSLHDWTWNLLLDNVTSDLALSRQGMCSIGDEETG